MMEAVGLDPVYCVSADSLTWEGMMRMTGCELELITDVDQHMFVEQGIRGGMSVICTRYATACNDITASIGVTIPPSRDEDSTNLLYFDCNSLYGHAMCAPLPIGGYEWVSHEQALLQWEALLEDCPNEVGYMLEVDLEYPAALHSTHDDYPLAPHRRTVAESELSQHSRRIVELGMASVSHHAKLMADFKPRQHYVLHHTALQAYVKYGMKVTAVHRILKFKQAAILAPYIMKNMERRMRARNSFEKAFFKLLNNALFGKTMENVRKYKTVRLVQGEAALRKLMRRPTLMRVMHMGGELAAVQLRTSKVKMMKPIAMGQAVLDISKVHMYDFHYGIWQPVFGSHSRLLFTDTDSLAYEVRGIRELNGFILQHPTLLDALDIGTYPVQHPLYSSANAGVHGKFKDELAPGGDCIGVMTEFAGLRAKVYVFIKHFVPWPFALCLSGTLIPADQKWSDEVKRAKGLQHAVLQRDVHFNAYSALACLSLEDLRREPLVEAPVMHHPVASLTSKAH
eukprot:gene12930-5964_t